MIGHLIKTVRFKCRCRGAVRVWHLYFYSRQLPVATCVAHSMVDTGNAGKTACSVELLKGQIRTGGSITSLHLSRYKLFLPISPELEIQPLRLPLSLRLHNPLPRAPEIGHLHPHPPFSQRHQPGLAADSLDIRAGEIVLLVDEFVKIDVGVEGHLRGVEVEDFAFGVFC